MLEFHIILVVTARHTSSLLKDSGREHSYEMIRLNGCTSDPVIQSADSNPKIQNAFLELKRLKVLRMFFRFKIVTFIIDGQKVLKVMVLKASSTAVSNCQLRGKPFDFFGLKGFVVLYI